MPPETWDEYTEAVTERKDWDTMQEFYRECMPLLEGRPFYAGKLEQRFLEKMLTRDLLEPSELIKRLEEYCTSVCSGAETVYREEALASPEDFDLILMDIQMPVMNGWEAARAIRRLPEPSVSHIPIIALSADAFDSDKQMSKESGMDAHLTKPIDIPLILETIARILQSRKGAV